MGNKGGICKSLKARVLVFWVMLFTLIVLFLPTTSLATEYKAVYTEVKAEDILKHIENGEDLTLTNCSIVGELNVSKITLETVPNQNSYTVKSLKNARVIKSNITITNSIFENNLHFSHVLFNNPINLSGARFNKSANFSGAYFNENADFSGAYFNENADFFEAYFNESSYFSGAYFNGTAGFILAYFNESSYFSGAYFNGTAYFILAYFKKSTDFSPALFNGAAKFSGAYFNGTAGFILAVFFGTVDFSRANFKDNANFSWALFNENADFSAPDTSATIITSDDTTCNLFQKYYKSKYRLKDASNIYFNYRNELRTEKNWYDISKWWDTIYWFTCGYGTKPSYILRCALFFIIGFTYFYRPHTTVSVVKSKNKAAPVKVYWKESGVYKLSDTAEKKSILSFWEALFFSINTFTRLGSSDLQARDNVRKWVTLEGLLGWITLALFMSIFTAYIIKL